MFVKLPEPSVPPQARAVDLATQIPSKSLHLRSLDNALRFTYNSLMYVLYALGQWTNEEWSGVEDTVAQHLATGTMFLGGALDGLVIAALPPHQPPSTSMSFERTAFQDAKLRELQLSAHGLRSALHANQSVYADFWTLNNFWKHYFPFQPRPSVFERSGNVRDFCVALGAAEGCSSGPVLHDLVIPTYNLAVDMLQVLCAQHKEHCSAKKISI